MQLDRLAAAIRPRTPWEGLDLGFALARNWFPALWGLWWLGMLPVAAVAAIWLPERPDLWLLLVWWFKPLYEAPLLYWLSRALFGESLGLRGLWSQRRQVLPRRLLPSLLWRRFQLSRSFRLPLLLLEGLSGHEHRRRQRVLQGTGGTAAWLTVICVHLESILWSSALLLILFLVPDELPHLDLSDALFDVGSSPYWVSACLYVLAMSLIGPFYVAAGFALYLTRRTELEAWDLELVFRRCAPQDASGRHRTGTAASILLLALLLSPAERTQAVVPAPEDARDLIAEVLAGEDFGGTREISTWRYTGELAASDRDTGLPAWLEAFIAALAKGASLSASLIKWILILLAAFLGTLVLRRILLDLHRAREGPEVPRRGPNGLRRLHAPTPATLPEDVPAAVGDLLAQDDARAALALLYRASVAHLLHRYGLEIPESATEAECLALVTHARPPVEVALIRRLTGSWQRLAYGHHTPDREQTADLLRDWQTWWRQPGEV